MTSQDSCDVLVTIFAIGDTVDNIPRREIFLSADEPSITIGRSSKRDSALEASRDNAWVDSPVVSRNHAELSYNAKEQTVTIKDLNSLHGTFHNGNRITTNVPTNLVNGDVLSIGIDIEHGAKKFNHYTMEVLIEYGAQRPARSENKPVVFQVPDDSDVESNAESDGDDDEPSVDHMQNLLRENKIFAKPLTQNIEDNENIPIVLFDDSDDEASVGDRDHISPNTTPPTSSPAKPTVDVCQAVEILDEDDLNDILDEDSLFGSLPGEDVTLQEVVVATVTEDAVEQAPEQIDPTEPSPVELLTALDSEEAVDMSENSGKSISLSAREDSANSKSPEASSSDVPKDELPVSPPAKRKACEISGEVPAALPQVRSVNDGERAQVSEKKVKLFRRIAEALGFAALGGVALASALLATAPAL